MSEQLEFSALFSKTNVTASFDTPEMTSDAGVLLLREIDKITGISEKLSSAIHDQRNPLYITHSMKSLLQQRIYQICQGYEDADDCDHLRKDAALKTASPSVTLSACFMPRSLFSAKRTVQNQTALFSM